MGHSNPGRGRHCPPRNRDLTRREQKAKMGDAPAPRCVRPGRFDRRSPAHATRTLPAALAERVRAGAAPGDADALPRLATGIDALDALLGGGFPRGRVSEITGPLSSGRTSLALALLAAATRAGEIAAVVDAADAFDPDVRRRRGRRSRARAVGASAASARGAALRRAAARSARLRRRACSITDAPIDARSESRLDLAAHEPQRDGQRHGAGAARVVGRASVPFCRAQPRSARDARPLRDATCLARSARHAPRAGAAPHRRRRRKRSVGCASAWSAECEEGWMRRTRDMRSGRARVDSTASLRASLAAQRA